MSSSGTMVLRGTLTGHSDWVTCIVVPQDNSDFILTGSRDKSLMKWNITKKEEEFGTPYRRYTGHNGYVEDVALSTDGQYALSGSWDGTLRLWDLQGGKSTRMFSGHKKDVLSVAFSGDNRQIVSGSRDRTLKLWNTLGECKYTISDQGSQNGHADWVSCVRFTPASCPKKLIVSAGWDKQVKVWDLQTCNLVTTLVGHTGVVNTVTISPDGSLCASGGKDGVAMLWELKKGEHLYSLEAGSTIHAMCFAPNRYWLVAATENSIKIWDLEKKAVVDELVPEEDPTAEKKAKSYCVSLAWSSDGTTLYSGYTDGSIRCWQARQ